MSRIALSLLLGLLPALAAAQVIYESKDAEGRPVYSDVPSPGATPMDLPPPNVIETDRPAPQPQRAQPAAPPSPPYTNIAILSPADEDTVHTNTGEFEVQIALVPDLRQGDTITVALDGTMLPTPHGSVRFSITSEEWESAAQEAVNHTLQATVMDAGGNALLSSSSIQFYVHRAFRKRTR